MAIINADVILELSQYLDIFSLLCLTHSCSVAFRASQEYTFWSPHKLHSSVGLAVFLPEDHIGPWRSYSGDKIRQAVIRMRNFKDRWNSEQVRATRRVHLGRYSSLEVIPGSRWLYDFHHDTSVGIVDGKTGMSTIQDLLVGPVDEYTEELPVAYSLEPNRILMGAPGEDESGNWRFALFEITLSVNSNAGDPYIVANSTRIRLWESVPASPTTFINREFLVIESEGDGWLGHMLRIYHIASSMHWEWFEMPEQQRTILLDHWCILAIGGQLQSIALVAIHLPSLLFHPDAAPENFSLPTGTTLPGSQEYPQDRYSVDVLPSRNRSSQCDGSSEYIVMMYNVDHRFSLDIQLEVIPGSFYGNIIWPGTKATLANNETLHNQISSQLRASGDNIPGSLEDRSPAPVWITTTQRAFGALVLGFDRNNYIQTVRIIDLDRSNHARMLDWKAPLKLRAGPGATAEDYQGDPYEIRALPFWNSSIGMLLLKGHPLSGGLQEYQTCWF